MPETIHAKVLCKRCKHILHREYNQTEAFLRRVRSGEYLLVNCCLKCLTDAERVAGWWKPERSHLQPVNE